MSVIAFLLFDAILLIAIGFFIWVYFRGSRVSTLELVANQKIHARNTEQAIMKMVEKKIAELDISEKRLNYLESRVAKVANRVERDRAKYKATGKTKAKRLWKRDRERRRSAVGSVGMISREAFERHLADERAKLYTKPVGA